MQYVAGHIESCSASSKGSVQTAKYLIYTQKKFYTLHPSNAARLSRLNGRVKEKQCNGSTVAQSGYPLPRNTTAISTIPSMTLRFRPSYWE
jgi:hypothetical protein